MKKYFYFLLLIFCCTILHAQESFVIRGLVVDAITLKPLAKATIVCEEKNIVAVTDNEGKYTLVCKGCKPDSSKIKVSFIGYETKVLTINSMSINMEARIRLKPTDKSLGDVIVNPDLLQYIFFGAPQSLVLDYVFFQSGWLIALYNYHEDKTSIIYMGKSKSILFEKEFPNKNFENFYVSCNGRYYAESANEIIELFLSNSGIDFKPVDYDFFNRSVKYYAGTKGKYFYITQFTHQNLFQGFYLDDTEKKKIEEQPFSIVFRGDDLNLLGLSELRKKNDKIFAELAARNYQAYNTGSFGINNDGYYDASDINISHSNFKENAYQKYMFKESFAPFYVMDSSLVIVNYYQNILERHAFDGKFIDTINLKIRNVKRESKQTFYDTFSKKIYYRSEDEDTSQNIYELKIATGKSEVKRKITRSDVYNLKVSNGYVYYLFNPPKTNKVFLFREKITE